MTLVAIILATLAAGIGSVWVAALLMGLGGGRSPGVMPQRLLSLAAGALLATAFMHLLPEAFESHGNAQSLFVVLLVGLVFFFLLSKAELWHHGHEHSHSHVQQEAHVHHHGHDHHHDHHQEHSHGKGGWAVLTGDSVHCFGDGILIASAFMADIRLGMIAALSVLAHEVPHHMGDIVVLRQSSTNRRVALIKVSMAGAVTTLGGVAGYFLLGQLHDLLPYFLTVASSSFIYVALADLIPQLQKRLSAKETVAQVFWLLLGIVLVTVMSGAAHKHGHEHEHDHEAEHSHSSEPPHSH
ncbi:ZIP family metal transporter [Comamonas resistens]|uniref:ZIP family metal transporter n=1 Tax=Comamonas resistens TaxID=3046670 RepID=A0ABY8SW28_9BURK|nr:ZIP family metal transporter [Comamonas resistens]MDL5035423.1 ZIP family metal transporter [Comamonas resistens]WHS66519.1 ZIP family metal transporter [Comamonas resistens]